MKRRTGAVVAIVAIVGVACSDSARTTEEGAGGTYGTTGTTSSSGGEATGASSSTSSSGGSTTDAGSDASDSTPPGFVVFSCSRENGIYGSDVTQTYARGGMVIDSNGYIRGALGTTGTCPFAGLCAPCAKPGACESETANACGALVGGIAVSESRVCETGPFAGMPSSGVSNKRLSPTDLAELLDAIRTVETSTAGWTKGPGCAVTYGCDGQRQPNGQCAQGCNIPDNGFHQGRIRVASSAHGKVAGFTDVDTFIDIHGLHVNTQLTVIRHNDPAAAVIRKYNCVQGLGPVWSN